ncbi:hypothetical protein ABFS82_09G052200 [Erythranthe guttata]|uniref:Uncharacterized protein n=1 Tax=Erythranthe guttata TaxID=4155 RepID=A0A022PW53_ERYGU|nr:PREDICTED: uncharacterized protein LOC105948974 [Erythranthe guttata]EYU19048.1 hypothetical protein MIMGU_mgv1a014353mg [Erythranthe guttata]|eukprot:XP_012827691.1 PREDICTED: uncharacterized protein LOC105948974 [Erythranthe guttata]
MALASSSSSRILCNSVNNNRRPCSQILQYLNPSRTSSLSSPFTVSATPKKTSSSPKTGKFDSKNRRTNPLTTPQEPETVEWAQIGGDEKNTSFAVDDGFVMPDLPGLEPNFWEGAQWDGLGFFVQYMWAFGIVFALTACGIAVATYNEGATDFKETPVYKEAIQSRDLLEEPDASKPDVFESNPTEEAPTLE